MLTMVTRRTKRTMLLAAVATAPVVAIVSCGSTSEVHGFIIQPEPDGGLDAFVREEPLPGAYDAPGPDVVTPVDASACADVMGRCDPNPPPDASDDGG
jgi:hypothetical protein